MVTIGTYTESLLLSSTLRVLEVRLLKLAASLLELWSIVLNRSWRHVYYNDLVQQTRRMWMN